MVRLAYDVQNVAVDERSKRSIASLVHALEVLVEHQVGDGIKDLIENAFFTHENSLRCLHFEMGP